MTVVAIFTLVVRSGDGRLVRVSAGCRVTLCPSSSLRYRVGTLISSDRIVGDYICFEVEAKTCGSKGLQHFD